LTGEASKVPADWPRLVPVAFPIPLAGAGAPVVVSIMTPDGVTRWRTSRIVGEVIGGGAGIRPRLSVEAPGWGGPFQAESWQLILSMAPGVAGFAINAVAWEIDFPPQTPLIWTLSDYGVPGVAAPAAVTLAILGRAFA
jgi:hypothetical protein